MSYPPSNGGQNPWPPNQPPGQGGVPPQQPGQQPGYPQPGGQQPGGQQPGGQQPAFPPAPQQPGYPQPGAQQPGLPPAPQQPGAQQPGFPPPGGQQPYPTTAPQAAPSHPYARTDDGWNDGKQPRRRKRGRLIAWIAAAVVLVLLIAGGIVGAILGGRANAPEREVEEYLAALVAGDAEAALTVSGAETGDAGVLLTDEVYSDVEDRISGFTVGEATISGDTAEVPVEITQGEESYEATFTLDKAGKNFVVFDTWKLQAPELGVVSYTLSAPEGTGVTVAGVDTTELAPADSGAVELPALPGTYTVAIAGDSTFFAAEPITVSVVGFGPDAATATTSEGEESNALTVTLTDEAVSAAEDAVNAYLDDCAASTDLRPDGCPFSAQGETPGYEYSNCVWTLEPRPSFTIGEYDGEEWDVSTEDAGTAALECDVRDPGTGGTGTATAGPMDVEVGGAITAFGEDGATYAP